MNTNPVAAAADTLNRAVLNAGSDTGRNLAMVGIGHSILALANSVGNIAAAMRDATTRQFGRPSGHAGTSVSVRLPIEAVTRLVQRVGQPVKDGRKMELHSDGGEWSALYVDGKLEEVGDTYYVTERTLALLGVREVSDSGFMRGQTRREGVAKTLDEVEEYAEQRKKDLDTAEALRVEAARLIAGAERLEKGERP